MVMTGRPRAQGDPPNDTRKSNTLGQSDGLDGGTGRDAGGALIAAHADGLDGGTGRDAGGALIAAHADGLDVTRNVGSPNADAFHTAVNPNADVVHTARPGNSEGHAVATNRGGRPRTIITSLCEFSRRMQTSLYGRFPVVVHWVQRRHDHASRETIPLTATFWEFESTWLRASLRVRPRKLPLVGLATLLNTTVALGLYYVMSTDEPSTDPATKAVFASALGASKSDIEAGTPTSGEGNGKPRSTSVDGPVHDPLQSASLSQNDTRSGTPAAPSRALEPPPSTIDDGVPTYVYRPAVVHLTHLALRRAQRCDPLGHAVGTARVFVTFAANGTVSAARLEDEPLASAPVSRCILHHARSIRIHRFDGAPFTFATSITMR
jgi:hypothetical protein